MKSLERFCGIQETDEGNNEWNALLQDHNALFHSVIFSG